MLSLIIAAQLPCIAQNQVEEQRNKINIDAYQGIFRSKNINIGKILASFLPGKMQSI